MENPNNFPSEFLSFKNIDLENSYFNKELEQTFMSYSNSLFEQFTFPSLFLSKQLGNIYCGSLYACLLSLLTEQEEKKDFVYVYIIYILIIFFLDK